MPKVTLAEAAQLYGVSERTLLRRIDTGEVKAHKQVIDGREHWIIEVGDDMPRHATVMAADMAAVMVVKDAEIADLKQEIQLLQQQIQAKDEQLKAKDTQIEDMGERLREANVIILQGQQKQIEAPGKKRWWQFWK